MEKESLLFSFNRFSGMNNVEEAFRIPVIRDAQYRTVSDMNEIENMDIDNSMVLSTRPGSDLKLAGISIHSLWSDEKDLCLFVDGSTLHRLNLAYTALEIGTIGSNRMSYAQWNDRVYMTNGTYIGYFRDNVLSGLTDPSVTYKLPLPAGKFIAYHQGRLYVASGKILYISDALCDHYDIRTGYRVFANNITMLIAVDKGLYVSDGVTYFLSEKRLFSDDPAELRRDQILDSDAIPYTAIVVNGKYLGDGVQGNGVQGNCALWVSTDGICLGNSDGTVKNLTRSRYSMSTHGVGSAAVRNVSETVHYIATLE
jgi:hypothetical protein